METMREEDQSYLKVILGWGDNSVIKAVVMQAQRPEFEPQSPNKSQHTPVIPVLVKQR